MPVPGTAAKPMLAVLPWAGFKAAASYTFDDTQPSHIEHFAEIKGTGVPVTWYVNDSNNWASGYDDAFKAAHTAGHELGNHTSHHCHYDLTDCTGALASADAEIDTCTTYIEDKLGADEVLTLAYPFGDVAWAPTARQRFMLARGTDTGVITFTGQTDPFNLPVFAATGGEAASVFNGALDDARKQDAWVIYLFHSLLPTDQNWYAGVNVTSVTQNIAYAMQAKDVWVDTVARIGAYWLGAKAVAAAESSAANGGMTWTWKLPEHFPGKQSVRVTVAGGELRQAGTKLPWDGHGYYEVALDAGKLEWSP